MSLCDHAIELSQPVEHDRVPILRLRLRRVLGEHRGNCFGRDPHRPKKP
jgi:hypothetical protein